MDDRVREDSFPATPASVGRARLFVAEVLRELGLATLVDEAVVVVSELATNAVRHAGTSFSVTVDCRSGGGALLSLRDGSSHRPIPGRAGPLEERGRGLTLVEGLCRDWGVSAQADGGKVVWAQLDLDSRGGMGDAGRSRPEARGDPGVRGPEEGGSAAPPRTVRHSP